MTLSVAFLGHGFVARAHAAALDRLPTVFPEAPVVERSVLVGRDPDRAARAADRLGFARSSTDPGDARDADAVYVLTPNDRHADPACAALARGAAVLCEKPLAATVDGAERMAAAAAASDAVAGVGFNYRFAPNAERARELVAEGALGAVRRVRARYLQDWLVDPEAPWSWRLDAERAGSGALGDLAAHSLDLTRYVTGETVERVAGHRRTFVDDRPVPGTDERRPVTVDDAATVQATLSNGALATVEASRVAVGRRNRHTVAVEGSAGAVRFDPGRPSTMAVCRDPAGGFESVTVTDPGDPYADRWWPPGHVLGWADPVVHENAAFLRAVAGDGSFGPTFADGLAVGRVLDAVVRADERGTWVVP